MGEIVDLGPVELRLFTFIPMSRVVDPFGVEYQADGPGFSYDRQEFRTRHTLIVDPSRLKPGARWSVGSGVAPKNLPNGFLIEDRAEVGMSMSYVPTVFLPGARIPILHGEIERDRADPKTSMYWYFRRARDGCFQIRMVASATNPVAVSRFFLFVPAIDYTVDFYFAQDGSARVSGRHDGFPAYDFYFQKRDFHRYDPIAVGASPLSLFGVTPDRVFEERRLR